jgi:hypothetical protein
MHVKRLFWDRQRPATKSSPTSSQALSLQVGRGFLILGVWLSDLRLNGTAQTYRLN